ncbi:DUF3221 domain-containing protein [Cohnella sp. GCM10027633]|uniref:DUF3221 domain-containing protein n=1 Tax=unclassified Cohnella TaxID=2636738 RepID=UPI00362B3A76
MHIMRRFGPIVLLLVCALFVLSACGDRDSGNGGDVKRITDSEQEQLPTDLTKLSEMYASHGVLLRSAYSTEDEVVVEVRQANKPWEALTAEQVEALKSDIYKKIGYSFKLRVDSFVLPKQADITGKVTAIEGNRALVVGKATEGGNANAVWVTLPAGMGSELKVGYGVGVWSDGMMLDSYPQQTNAVQLQVTDFEVGEGDLQGAITKVSIGDDSIENNYVEVDGVKFQLLAFTNVMEDGKSGGLDRLKVGARVQVWTLGYVITEEQRFASQINVLR